MAQVLERIRRAGRPPFHRLGVAAARAAYRAPLPEVRDLQLPAADGTALAARWYRPVAAAPGTPPLPALLYFHGGGFTIGGLETHDSLCRQLARRSGAAVLALGLAAQLLITPGTTAHADTPSHRRYAEGYLLDAASIAWFFDHYLPVAQRRDWRFAPLEAPDVDGVAPAGLVLAECDPLVDEGLAYADRLRAAGVPVALELARGMTHDFIKMGRVLPEAAAAQQAAADFLRQAFQETP
ncbi:alpha/beta hydrolase fold domain-containing protein [Piscinibacter sakaiensis]|uniref:alpha/beta hydrolase fold domain-containing protein n=1 Tax=Piscinibacter sakaiensis TaxID=1547922 RepID=UPI00372B0F61